MSHPTITSLLKHNRDFRLLYLGQFISFIGTMITNVALPYQIYHATQSTLMVGLLSLSQLLPLLITALIGGVVADHHNRRTLLIWTETSLGIGCLLLAINAFFPATHITLTAIFIIASIMSAITGLHRPALDSIAQQIVSKKDFSALGVLSSFKWSACSILGPAIGGIIISHYGLVITFLVDFISFLISLILLLRMTRIPTPPYTLKQSTWRSLKEGIHYAVSRQELIGTYSIDFVAMIFGMPHALFPAIAQSLGGVKTLGLLYSAPAVGALIISFCSGWISKIKRHGAAIAIAAILWGFSIILFGLAHHLLLTLLFLAFAGAFDAISGIFRSIMWNATIPNQLRGRLAGIEMISYLSGPKLGDTEAGFIAAAFGITASIVSGGLLCIAGVAISCYFLPHFWKYRSE